MTRNLNETVRLGPNGPEVARLGIGSSYGIGEGDIRHAFDEGVDFFYWGATRTRSFGRGLNELARLDRPAVRIAIQSFSRSAVALRISTERALRGLGIDYADFLILGYWAGPVWKRIMNEAMVLRERGLVRALAVSSHSPQRLPRSEFASEIDLLLFRYNPAHRKPLEGYLDTVGSADRPGMAAFTATMWGWTLKPECMPPGEEPPSATDCYRYALSHPAIDMVLCGPADRGQLDEALQTLRSSVMSADELERMNRIGDHMAGRHVPTFYKF